MKRLVRLAAEVPPALDLVLRKDVRDLVKLGLRQLDVSSGEILERTRRLPVDDGYTIVRDFPRA